MNGYRLATLRAPEGPCAAVIVGDSVYDAAKLLGDDRYSTMQGLLDSWEKVHASLALITQAPNASGIPIHKAEFLAPIPRPNVIYCAGANYRDHAEEMAIVTGRLPEANPRANGARPWFFLKSPHSVVPSGAIVRASQYSKALDWEAELVAVIGRKARNVSVEEALDYVAGYTCGNDLSARDQGFRTSLPEVSPFRADWTRHKSFDDACPMGPWIVPAAYVREAASLPIRLWVNDELKQDSNSANMIFSTAEQISCLSESMTLHPGDMIMTGTPAGVGAARREFLKAGDVVRIEIAEIGVITNSIA